MFAFLDRLERTQRKLDRLLPEAPVDPPAAEEPADRARQTEVGFVEFVQGTLGVRLTDAQRVLAGVAYDRVEPAELETEEDRALARTLFGDVDAFPVTARRVLSLVKGARCGGSYVFGGLYSLWRALTADLSRLAPGERASALIVAPNLKLARQTLRHALGAMKKTPELGGWIPNETADSFTVRRPDWNVVTIEVLPATRGGSAVRGRWLVSAVLDECGFFFDSTSVVNDIDVFRAVIPRVLPGGMVVLESTAWLENGLLFDEFSKNFGKPSTSIAAHAPTLVLFDSPEQRAMVAAEELRDPDNAAREFGGQFLAYGTGVFFPRDVLKLCKADGKGTTAAPGAGELGAVGGDLGLTNDASAFVAVHRVPDPTRGEQRDPRTDRYRVVECVERKPARGAPLKLGDLVPLAAELALRHGQKSVLVDQWSAQPAREHCPPGFSLETEVRDEAEQYDAALELMKAGLVEIPGEFEALLRQLPLVMSKPTPGGGKKIILPRKFGSHCDLVPAFVKALWKAKAQTVGQTLEQPTNVRQRAFARQRGY